MAVLTANNYDTRHVAVLGRLFILFIRSSPERWPNKPGKNVCTSTIRLSAATIRPQTK